MLLREGDTEAERVGQEYEETDKALAAKKELGAEDQEELGRLWKNLVKLDHPDRFRHEPDKLETVEKLTAAINHAKDSGDSGTLRQIAGDPQGFILRQGWAGLDFREEEQAARLRKLWESLELEILAVLEATRRGSDRRRARESADVGFRPRLLVPRVRLFSKDGIRAGPESLR